MNINGLVRIPGSSQKKKYFFSFNGKSLLIYKNNAIPLEDHESKEDAGIKSPDYQYTYLIGEEYSKNPRRYSNNRHILFFIHDTQKHDESKNKDFSSIEGWQQTIKIKVYFYIKNYNIKNSLNIQKIQLSFPELDYFFHVGKRGFKYTFDDNQKYKGLEIIPYDKNKVPFSFHLESKEIDCKLGVDCNPILDSITPFKFQSLLSLHFEKTNDIDFIIKLYIVIQNLFSYLCRRKNINIDSISLHGEKDNKIINLATLHVPSNGAKENEKNVQKIVEYEDIKENLPKLIQLIADQNVCLEHLCNKKSKCRTVTPARTIAVMSAFESNIKKLYPKEEFKKNNTSEKNSESCKNEPKKEKAVVILRNMLDRFNDVLEPFILNLCKLNKVPRISNVDIAKSATEQRNTYAHGYILTKENENFLLSFIIVEYLNYCMVLKYAGYDDSNIKKIIKGIYGLESLDV